MATIAPTSDIIGAGTALTLASPGDIVYVKPDIELIGTSGAGISMPADNRAQIHGSVYGNSVGIAMGHEVPGGEVYVGETGNVGSGVSTAIIGQVAGDGGGGRYSLYNAGDVTSQASSPTVYFLAPEVAVGAGESGEDLFLGGDYAITNSGRIVNTHFDSEAEAIYLHNIGFLAQINNAEDGVISQIGDMGTAIKVAGQIAATPTEGGVLFRISEIRTVNAGEIFAEWYAYDSVGRGIDHLVNTGLMRGDVRLGLDDDYFNGEEGRVYGVVEGGAGQDRLLGGGFADLLNGGRDADHIHGRAGDDSVEGGTGDDVILGGAGADLLFGEEGGDTLRGGAGEDDLNGGNGSNHLHGGTGDDTVISGTGADMAWGGQGEDSLNAGAGDDWVNAGAGDDTVIGGFGFDTVSGGKGDDLIYLGGQADLGRGGDGDDEMYGFQGFDTLRGGRGDDSLFGGTEADSLGGGAGRDMLTGGPGFDVFVFAPGDQHDTVTDYVDGTDRIDLSAYGLAGYGALTSTYTVEARAGGVRLTFNAGDVLDVLGASLGTLGASDFLF